MPILCIFHVFIIIFHIQLSATHGFSVTSQGIISGLVHSASPDSPPFLLTLLPHTNGVLRMRLVEENDMIPRWEVSNRH